MAIDVQTIISQNNIPALMVGYVSFMEDLIDRTYNGKTPRNPAKRYRLSTIQPDGSLVYDIVTLANFSSKINNSKVKLFADFKAGPEMGITTQLLHVLIENINVEFDVNDRADSRFLHMFGKDGNRLLLTMCYVNDASSEVPPVKILAVKVVNGDRYGH